MTAPELLPCPFCGGEASHNGGGGSRYGRFWWIVGCKTCDIWVSDPEIWDKKNPGMLDPAYPAKWCLAAWNRRTPSPEVAALIAESRRKGWNAAIEASAALVEGSVYTLNGGARTLEPVSPKMRGIDMHHATIAVAIRALKEETP